MVGRRSALSGANIGASNPSAPERTAGIGHRDRFGPGLSLRLRGVCGPARARAGLADIEHCEEHAGAKSDALSLFERTARDLLETADQRERLLAVEHAIFEYMARQYHVHSVAIMRQRQADALGQHRHGLSVECEDVLRVHRAAAGGHLSVYADDIAPVAGGFRQNLVNEPTGGLLSQGAPKHIADPAISEARHAILPKDVEQHYVRPDIAGYFDGIDIGAGRHRASLPLSRPVAVERL